MKFLEIGAQGFKPLDLRTTRPQINFLSGPSNSWAQEHFQIRLGFTDLLNGRKFKTFQGRKLKRVYFIVSFGSK